ncbi:hypothetical protein OSR35_02830 [Paenarthrobacter ureafaciens]|uniref:hypothetical protein n=1 Tax=Paenarthrobacter ureafaciens TaxID=37931 RepID=UPI00196B7F60|nr:hypothetical protein [Paenarthrobacter ureafaciens]MCX8453048.1 hypothetical protein [Paenarthrobacter ureafaciens]MCX8453050.1 hypothetical protein [Paenarthrobacter ureafaciens]
MPVTDEQLNKDILGAADPDTALKVTLCTFLWLDSVLVGHFVDWEPDLYHIGLAGHVVALTLAFGAILVVDWLGLLWLLGKVRIHEPSKLEALAKPLIWGGMTLLLLTGALIRPDLGNPVTCLKLICVLALMLNGLAIGPTMHRLGTMPARTRFADLGRRIRLRLLVLVTVSQACWWTAVLAVSRPRPSAAYRQESVYGIGLLPRVGAVKRGSLCLSTNSCEWCLQFLLLSDLWRRTG